MANRGNNMRNRRWFTVEQKSFEMEFEKDNAESMRVSLVERSLGRTFKATTSEGGARWMGGYLCECSTKFLKSMRYHDSKVVVLGCIQKNERGEYVKFTCFSKNLKGSGQVICFPAGVEEDGWAVAGLTLLSLFDRNVEREQFNSEQRRENTSHHQLSQPSWGREWPVLKKGDNIETPVMSNEWSPKWTLLRKGDVIPAELNEQRCIKIPRVSVHAKHGILNLSWWSAAVVCTPSERVDSWRPILGRICECFGEAEMTGLKNGEAIIFLRDTMTAEKLAGMKPLSWEGTVINFRRWVPEFNSIPHDRFTPKEQCINLIGIPLHLRKMNLVKELVQSFSSKSEVDEESLQFKNCNVRVKIFDGDWELIPRVAIMEERGYCHKILIEIIHDEPVLCVVPEKQSASDREEPEVVVSSGESQRFSDHNGKGQGATQEYDTKGAWDHFKLKQTKQVDKPDWLTWRQVKDNRGNVTRNGTVPDTGADCTVDVGENVGNIRQNLGSGGGLGRASFFGPLMDLNTEEEFGSYMSDNILPGGGTHHVSWRPNKHVSWGHGPSLNVWKQKQGVHLWKKQREKNKKLVRNVLQNMKLGSTEDVSPQQRGSEMQAAPSPMNSHSLDFTRLPTAAHTHEQGESSKSGMQIVSLVEESSNESSCPPGFSTSENMTLKEKLNKGCNLVQTKEELVEWILGSAKHVAAGLGMTSNRGNKFVESSLLDVGTKNLKSTSTMCLNEDELERINYAESNRDIGDIEVPDVV
ncbi:hypothetical protein FRX31_022386 [Thalictrum thalictroides]|uniref:DUF4283 domain-containing protein n=1 Tax=Thalictrum thalictroides TaxID=46969 RepID=A0A7J6VSF5_THATH|nr:hypothetical protein FRX31_022386 [Thalictrum thalictroides]